MKHYIFAGNRFPVLKVMLEQGIKPVRIIVAKDSYLEEELKRANLDFLPMESKAQLCDIIKATDFDFLISHGCPYILPVSQLKKPHQEFINIHPSFLPDLKGINPVNGAILFNRSAGATCHIMDDGIDTGPIIARIEIPLTADVDLGLLYQLSFMAEREVFLDALGKNFIPDKKLALPLIQISDPIYYTRKEKDRAIDFSEDLHTIVRRIKAFGIASQKAYFDFEGSRFHVLDAEMVANIFLLSRIERYAEGEIAFCYEDTIVLRKHNAFLKLKGVSGTSPGLVVGRVL